MNDAEATMFSLGWAYQLVVAQATDGTRWAGTPHWIVKERGYPPRSATVEAIDRLANGDYRNVLQRVTVDHEHAVLAASQGLLRLYRRDDGGLVRINDSIAQAVESMLAGEDEEGEETPADLELRQVADVLGPIGVHEQGELVAVVMPVRDVRERRPS